MVLCSAGKGPFVAGKANNMCQRGSFMGGGGGGGVVGEGEWSEGHDPALAGKFRG